jgi:hypothetical protein
MKDNIHLTEWIELKVQNHKRKQVNLLETWIALNCKRFTNEDGSQILTWLLLSLFLALTLILWVLQGFSVCELWPPFHTKT